MIEIDLSQVDRFADDLDNVAVRVIPAVSAAVGRGGLRTQARAQSNAPVEFGTLQGSITTDHGGLSFEVGPEVEYGGYVEEGTTGPYLIENAFGWGIAVEHPGISPQPYLGPAFDRELPKTLRDIHKAAADRTLR